MVDQDDRVMPGDTPAQVSDVEPDSCSPVSMWRRELKIMRAGRPLPTPRVADGVWLYGLGGFVSLSSSAASPTGGPSSGP